MTQAHRPHPSLAAMLRACAEADGLDSGVVGPWWWRGLATPLSHLYGLIGKFRAWTFDHGLRRAKRLPGITISIGNLAAGGTGKSPMTLRLAELLLGEGARPVILTRGYGSDLAASDSLALLAGQILMLPARAARPPDEGRMQSAILPTVPVVVGRRRFAAAQRFLREHPHHAPTHWLLDDGMQHRQLARDIELVLLDAHRPLPRLMPRGVGRESASALKRADLVLLTRCRPGVPSREQLASLAHLTAAPLVLTSMQTALPKQSVSGDEAFTPGLHTPVCLVSGVARPQALCDAVSYDLGLSVGGELRLADHQLIDRQQLATAAIGCQAIVTTAKDYWRDPAVFAGWPQPVFVLSLAVVGADQALLALIKQSY